MKYKYFFINNKKKIGFSEEKLNDYFYFFENFNYFYFPSAWRRLSNYLKIKKGYQEKREKEKFQNFLKVLQLKKLVVNNNEFYKVVSFERLKKEIFKFKEERNFFIVKISSKLWKDFRKQKILAFKQNDNCFKYIKPGDEAIVLNDNGEILGISKIKSNCIFCNHKLINKNIFPYQISVTFSPFKDRLKAARKFDLKAINKIKAYEFFNTIFIIFEKQLEAEIFKKSKLLDLYFELEDMFPDDWFLKEKIANIFSKIAKHINLEFKVSDEKLIRYYEFLYKKISIRKYAFITDLYPYIDKTYHSNERFKLLVPGNVDEKNNLISIERLFKIFKLIIKKEKEIEVLFS